MASPPTLDINPVLSAITTLLLVAAMQTILHTYKAQAEQYPQESALLDLFGTAITDITNSQANYQRRLEGLPKKSWNCNMDEARQDFVCMVMDQEKSIADCFRERESEWKYEQLKGQLMELVMKEPALGVVVVKAWELRIQFA